MHFTIQLKAFASADISVSGVSDQAYTGQPVSLIITVTDTKINSGKQLTEGTDCTVSYQKADGTAITAPSEEGSYKVILTGRGNYTGSVTKAFQITRDVITIVPAPGQGKTFGAADPAVYTYTAYRNYGAAGQAEVNNVTGLLTRVPGENAGSYAYDISGLSALGASAVLATDAGAFTIQPKSLAEGDTADGTAPVAVLAIPDQVYDSTGKTPVPVVTYTTAAGQTLSLMQDEDFTVSYYVQADRTQTVTPTAVGTYIAVLTATDGNYIGTREVTFEIVGASGGLNVTPGHIAATYDRQDHKPTLAVSFNGQLLDAANYTVTYTYNGSAEQELTDRTEFVDAGTYVITVTAQNGYTGFAAATVVISPAKISSVALSETRFSYDGTAKAPTVTAVKAGALALSDGEYTANTPQNAFAPGSYTVTVAASSPNFTGSATVDFIISTGGSLAVGAVADHIYDGAPYLPKPEVRDDGTVLTEGRDYTLTYQQQDGSLAVPLHAGRYTVAVTGVGSYAGKTATADFKIAAKDIADTQSGSGLVTVRVDDAVYDGTEKKPAVVVTYATRDGRVIFLTEGTDYTLLHSSNTNVGTAATQITGRGDYAGSREVAFQITAADGGKLDVAPLSPVVYSGMDQKPSLTVSAGGQNVGSYEATYTYNGGAVQDLADAAFVNAGTYAITVTAKDGNFNGAQGTATFVIRPAEISRTELDENALVYTGNPIEPRVTQVTAGAMEVPSTSHRVVYSNNQLVGTASVTVFSIDPNFTGSVTKEFQITGGSLYAVTYDGNGATGGNVPMDSSTYLAGNSVILLGNNEALERTDAVFVGWSTEKTELLTSEAQAAQVTIVRPGTMLQMPAGGLKVYAVWAQDGNQDGRPDYQETVTIIASAGPGGTISPSGSQAYAWGTASVKYAITVENGYSFAGVRVDGTQVAVSTPQAPTALAKNGDGTYTYTFGMLTGNHTIAATFQQLSGGGTGGGGAGGGSGAGGGAGTSGGAGGGGAGAGGGGAGGGGTAPPKPDAPDATKPLDPAGSGVEDWLETEKHVAFLRGYPGSRFDPDRSMTRAEVAQLFYNLLLKRSVDVPAAFENVAPDAWYAEAVSALAALGVLEGVGHGRFAPERNITRAEFAAIAMRFGKQQPDGENIFSDVSETDWYYGAVVNSIRYGWITGYPDGTFRPTSSITRSEVAVMVNRMLGRRADRTYIREHGGMLIGFKDLPERHWAYFDVMEAANSHDHRRQSDAEVWTGHHS